MENLSNLRKRQTELHVCAIWPLGTLPGPFFGCAEGGEQPINSSLT